MISVRCCFVHGFFTSFESMNLSLLYLLYFVFVFVYFHEKIFAFVSVKLNKCEELLLIHDSMRLIIFAFGGLVMFFR